MGYGEDDGGEYRPSAFSARVTADPGSVNALTVRFVHGSARYRALCPLQRHGVDATLTVGTCVLTRTGRSRDMRYRTFKTLVARLERTGWLTEIQASVLSTFADSL
jgi:hypothetical protein